jgi:uncharacterized delta-60 repeat protein/gliding motility-associated-like protein
MRKIILLALFLITSNRLFAQTGYLDTTFNKTGSVKGQQLMNNLGGGVRALALDDQGRIVVTSCSTTYAPFMYVFRLNTNGTVDGTFGSATADTVKINLKPYGINGGGSTCLAIQKDGKILIGGVIDQGATMFVLRLNSDGSRDASFDSDGIVILDLMTGIYENLSAIAVQSNGRIILSGTVAGKITILGLLPDGTIDTGFIQYKSSITYTETAAGLKVVNDTIVAGGSYSPSGSIFYFFAVKLAQDGSLVWRNDLSFTASSANIGDIAIQPDGKIILAGPEYSSFRAFRLLPNSNIDNSFGVAGTFVQTAGAMGPSLKSVVLEKNGKINFVGHLSSNYIIMRTDTSGNLDLTFGAGGKLSIPTMVAGGYLSYSKSILSHDQKILIAGDINSTSTEILKVEIKPVVHIIGNGYAAPGDNESYTVQIPASWGPVTYQWTYTGLNFNYVPNQTTNPLILLFSKTATSGKLTCKITSAPAAAAGVLLGTGEIDIVINPKGTSASQLAVLDCPATLTNCALGYIDNFSLNTLRNPNSGCSDNGYSDYTQCNLTDTLAAGGVYSATLKIPNDGSFTSYVGIWIDYNNDGNFSNIDEFVGEAFSKEAKVKVDIFLKNREGYEGVKRIRVRSRPDFKITSTESCPSNGEAGETEDYLILLDKQPSLEAPQIITPNEDGLNDYFVIHGVDPNKKNKLTIFDRIGAVKFSASNYENDWNGTAKDGTKLSPGTYYYVFTNDKNSVKGFIEIRY